LCEDYNDYVTRIVFLVKTLKMINAAHLHLLSNHFPIVLPFIGLLLLIAGLVLKSELVKRLAYILFVLGAIGAFITSFSGEQAEEIVEELGRNHHLMHEHEELAERFALVSYILGLLSIAAFYLNWKNKPHKDIAMFIVMIVACATLFFARQTGTSGGKISHPEIGTVKEK